MMNWITANWGSLISILTGVVTISSVVAKLTPTEVDNKVVGTALQVIDVLALNNKPTVINKASPFSGE
jgi:hypothetical protein